MLSKSEFQTAKAVDMSHTILCDAIDRMASDSDMASFISGTDRHEEAGEGATVAERMRKRRQDAQTNRRQK